jgi:MoaA/NifB/PqqE/SkfB family radical SAM enzyme
MIYHAKECKCEYRPSQKSDFLSAEKNQAPRSLFIEPSSECNLKCKRCEFHHAKAKKLKKQESHMTMGTFRLLIENLILLQSPFKVVHFNLHGEPLLNPVIAEMIHLAHAQNIAEEYSISTNGIMLTNSKLHQLISAGIDTININLETARLHRYLEIKGDDKLDIVLDNVVNALEVISSHSRNICLTIKVAEPSIINGISEEDIESVMLFFGKHAENSKKIHIEICKEINCFTNFTKNISSINHNFCKFPFSKITIHYDGMVSFCCMDINYALTLGQLTHAYSISEMLQGKNIYRNKNLPLSQDVEPLPECKMCDNRPITRAN